MTALTIVLAGPSGNNTDTTGGNLPITGFDARLYIILALGVIAIGVITYLTTDR